MNAEIQTCNTQNNQMELFLRISQKMLAITDQEEFFQVALQDIGESIGASRVFIFNYVNSLWYEKHVWVRDGLSSVRHLLQGVSLDFVLNSGEGRESFFQGNIKIITDVEKEFDGVALEFMQHIQVLSAVLTPLFVNGKLLGFLGANICSSNNAHISKESAQNWASQHAGTIQTLGHLLNVAGEHYRAQNLLHEEEVIALNMLDVLPIPFYVINPRNHHIILQNKAFRKFINEDRLPLKKCYKILHDYDKPCEFCGISKVRFGGEANVRSYHNEALGLDLMVIENSVSWGKLKNAHAVTFIDITDSLRLEKEKILTRESVKAKARFLANMSHELRTPVNGIVGMTQLAEKNNSNALVANYLEKIKDSSKKLLAVINNILDFSKIEAGKMDIECTVFNLQSTFELFIFNFIKEANAKNLEAIVNIDKNIPKLLKGDPLRLLQIIKNLAGNAIKFTENGHVSLAITCDTNAQEQSCILSMEIKDTGIGISNEQIKSLFEIFYLGDASFSRQYDGTGIGLAVAKGLCSLMNGKISVQSELGQGSIFTCSIPFLLAHDDEAALHSQHLTNEQQKLSSEFSLEGTKVLLAEDNEINIIIALEVLQSFGCSVDVATDGIQVIEMVNEKEFDIVLMDLEMPRMSGFEATEKLRENAQNDTLPIVGMSAHSVQDMKKRLKIMGKNAIQDYISKPFEAQNLKSIICRHARNFQ